MKIVMGTCVIVVSTLLHAWCLMLLWSWFVVPPFGLHPLTAMQALGLGLCVRVFASYTPPTKDTSTWTDAMVRAIVVPLVHLLLGWVVHLFL
jgi:hypothetical protein